MTYAFCQVYIKMSILVNIIVHAAKGGGSNELIVYSVFSFVHVVIICCINYWSVPDFTKASILEQISHVLVNTILVMRFKPSDDLSLLGYQTGEW